MYVYSELTHNLIETALREDEWADWTYAGAQALARWLIDLSEDLGEPVPFDRVAMRCEWSELEWTDFAETAMEHGFEFDPERAYKDQEGDLVEFMRERAEIIPLELTVLVREF